MFSELSYDGIVFVDADTIPVRSLSPFFSLPYDVALAFDQYWGCHIREELISSVYFFKPSRHLSLAVLEFFDPHFTVPCAQNHLPTADQSVLNCLCATARAEFKPWPGDVTCGKLPWFTQIQPQLLMRQCVEFNASDVYVLHYGGPPKPWLGWLEEDGHADCGRIAKDATQCQPAEWFARDAVKSCFTQQAGMFTYWLCQQAKQRPRLELLGKTQRWQQLDDMEDIIHDPCPCALHVI